LQAHPVAIDQKALRRNRIGAYIGAALMALLAIWLLSGAISVTHVMEVSGTVQELYALFPGCGRAFDCYNTYADCRSGHYDCSSRYDGAAVRLIGDSNYYLVHPDTLHPPLSHWFVSSGDEVHLWFTDSPLIGREVVAIRIVRTDGPSGVLHTNGGYTDPASERNIFLGLTVFALALAVGSFLLGRYLEPLAYTSPLVAKVCGLQVKPPKRHHKRGRKQSTW
jgi:hypothetical protein